MAYKLSERLHQNKLTPPPSQEGVDLGKVATVFILYGILSLVIAWVFSTQTKELINNRVGSAPYSSVPRKLAVSGEQEEARDVAMIGPITVEGHHEVYEISIAAPLPANSWAFVEGEVLDAGKNYLFSFGKELWHETGEDYEGVWVESDTHYVMKITLPELGQYYLNLKTQGGYYPRTLDVVISKKRGSIIPHMVFGIVTILIGILLNEIQNETLSRTLRETTYE
jgi:hypothetical protein